MSRPHAAANHQRHSAQRDTPVFRTQRRPRSAMFTAYWVTISVRYGRRRVARSPRHRQPQHRRRERHAPDRRRAAAATGMPRAPDHGEPGEDRGQRPRRRPRRAGAAPRSPSTIGQVRRPASRSPSTSEKSLVAAQSPTQAASATPNGRRRRRGRCHRRSPRRRRSTAAHRCRRPGDARGRRLERHPAGRVAPAEASAARPSSTSRPEYSAHRPRPTTASRAAACLAASTGSQAAGDRPAGGVRRGRRRRR